ncbi:MAG: GAF domain-containing protein [Desulfosarcina sp.]|jgi:GAF domain-containing protein
MEESKTRSYGLAKKLAYLFDLESNIDTILSASMYYLNQFMNAERSSVFLFQHWNQKLTIFSSLDLEKHEVHIPKASGVAGWVFVNRKSAVVNNAYEDSRFCQDVDALTGFQTRNMVCSPLVDTKKNCLGTIQSLNKQKGDFSTDDLELLELAAGMVAVAIKNSERYNEMMVSNEASRKFIQQINDSITSPERVDQARKTDDGKQY